MIYLLLETIKLGMFYNGIFLTISWFRKNKFPIPFSCRGLFFFAGHLLDVVIRE